MLTNILATVQILISTNVATSDNSSGCPMYAGPNVSSLVYGHTCTPFVAATERYLTTNVVEETSVKVVVEGRPMTFRTERTLSSVTTTLRMKGQWEPTGTRTNATTGAVGLGNGVIQSLWLDADAPAAIVDYSGVVVPSTVPKSWLPIGTNLIASPRLDAAPSH